MTTTNTTPERLTRLAEYLSDFGFTFTAERSDDGEWSLVDDEMRSDYSTLVIYGDSVAYYSPGDWLDGNAPTRTVEIHGSEFGDVFAALKMVA
jgi:hypothetical protein